MRLQSGLDLSQAVLPGSLSVHEDRELVPSAVFLGVTIPGMLSDNRVEMISGKERHRLTENCGRVLHTKKPVGVIELLKVSTPLVWLNLQAFSIWGQI